MAGALDVALDVELLLLELVGVDLEGLDEGGVDEAAEDAGDHPEADSEGRRPPAGAEQRIDDRDKTRERPEGDQRVARGQPRVDVRERRPGHDPTRRRHEVEHAEVGAEGNHEQDQPAEHGEVDAHPARQLHLEAL